MQFQYHTARLLDTTWTDNICHDSGITSDEFKQGCVNVIDSALSVEDTTFENSIAPFTSAISRTQDLVNNGNVTNITSRFIKVDMTRDEGNTFFLLYDQSTEDNIIIKDGTYRSGDDNVNIGIENCLFADYN